MGATAQVWESDEGRKGIPLLLLRDERGWGGGELVLGRGRGIVGATALVQDTGKAEKSIPVLEDGVVWVSVGTG